jgi:biopolymer transport protein TolR
MARSVRRKPMAEINVVPYIDVMLVLLVIFMVTAPLLSQGIKVDLPKAVSEVLDVSDDEALLVVSIRADGSYYMNVGEEEEAVDLDLIGEKSSKIIKANPTIKVLIEADQSLQYGVVVDAMNVLQNAGAETVGLITEPPES